MSATPPEKAFESIRDQIGYCGIWCGSCVAGNGTLQELTRRYRSTTEAYDLKEWAPKDFDYAEFAKGLASIQEMPHCPGCLKGGGNPECVMRKCAQEKQLTECSACPEFGTCKHREALEKMRAAALGAGLIVKTDTADPGPQIAEWTEQLRDTWPTLLLFMDRD